MNLWFQSSVLGINNVWPYKYLLLFFCFFFLEFYSLMILSLLNCLYVTYGQNGSILDLDIVIFTGMFSPLKNSTSFSLGVVHRLAALVSPGMPVRYRISDPNPELFNQNLHFNKILADLYAH